MVKFERIRQLYVERHSDPHITSWLHASKDISGLQERHSAHCQAVEHVLSLLRKQASVTVTSVTREQFSSATRHEADLVVTVGGDGTLLAAAHGLADDVPLVGINSDPSPAAVMPVNGGDGTGGVGPGGHMGADLLPPAPHLGRGVRSTGALCAATAANAEVLLEQILAGERHPAAVRRIRTVINGCGTLLPPALNDVFISNPCPAGVSRLSLSGRFVRSSGLRVCSAMGATAAMRSAGGLPMHPLSPLLQYMVVEPIADPSTTMAGAGASTAMVMTRADGTAGMLTAGGEATARTAHAGHVGVPDTSLAANCCTRPEVPDGSSAGGPGAVTSGHVVGLAEMHAVEGLVRTAGALQPRKGTPEASMRDGAPPGVHESIGWPPGESPPSSSASFLRASQGLGGKGASGPCVGMSKDFRAHEECQMAEKVMAQMPALISAAASTRPRTLPPLHGFVQPECHLCVAWASRRGTLWVDGTHVAHPLNLGDQVVLCVDERPLWLFRRDPPRWEDMP
eukprot:jgi/Mesvir1/9259/Mv03124-RA.2